MSDALDSVNPTPPETPPEASLEAESVASAGQDAPADAAKSATTDTDVEKPLAPPSFGRQMAQLVVIPAAIAIAGILIVILFSVVLSPKANSAGDLVRKIQQTGGVGKIGPFSDPRNSERYRAAATLSQMIRDGEVDSAEYASINKDLMEVLNRSSDAADENLQSLLVFIVGQLGQAGGFEAIEARLTHDQPMVRQFAIKAALLWPDQERTRSTVGAIRSLLSDPDIAVQTEAARAIGALATKSDAASIEALRQSMMTLEPTARDLRWNAAIALARLGDEQGGAIVADVLLDRKALADMPAEPDGPGSLRKMPQAMQDQVIWLTLHAVGDMTQPEIWRKIEWLAEHDSNPAILKKAAELLADRASKSPSP